MALKIRLKRMGNKNRPFYRLVVQDSKWKRDGKTVADIGWYDPLKQPAQVKIKDREVYHWLEKGAQISDTARSLIKRAGLLEKFKSGAYKTEMESSDGSSTTIIAVESEKKEKKQTAPEPVNPVESATASSPQEENPESGPAASTEVS